MASRFNPTKLIALLILILLFSAITIHSSAARNSRPVIVHNRIRSTALDFVLPGSLSLHGRYCALFSSVFCLSKYWQKYNNATPAYSSSLNGEHQELKLLNMARSSFRRLNWFSFYESDWSYGCCEYQQEMYRRWGLLNNLTAVQYFGRLTDFRNSKKNLITLQAVFDSTLCGNVITRLSFGKGEIRVKGTVPNVPVMVAVPGIPLVYVFQWRDVFQRLKFAWFKTNIICAEQPWICSLI
ncbi:uncharacterized protein LOC134840380 [Symsagittifera roscoffensis]|uniref:uncharacterized protein LOC134840380 n=1 Tax=Symsagittifera roscoffensis TaxID=84072 RepID=UPI00307B6428